MRLRTWVGHPASPITETVRHRLVVVVTCGAGLLDGADEQIEDLAVEVVAVSLWHTEHASGSEARQLEQTNSTKPRACQSSGLPAD